MQAEFKLQVAGIQDRERDVNLSTCKISEEFGERSLKTAFAEWMNSTFPTRGVVWGAAAGAVTPGAFSGGWGVLLPLCPSHAALPRPVCEIGN